MRWKHKGGFSEDLELFLSAWRSQGLPVVNTTISEAIDRTRAEFAKSPQVKEALGELQQINTLPDVLKLRNARAADLWKMFSAVSSAREYNQFAEYFIEATGLGTYPLVRQINAANPRLEATRNDIRGLYSNRRPVRDQLRYSRILEAIARLIPPTIDPRTVTNAYLLRKTHRIIGPQSAINPLEILVTTIFQSQQWNQGVSCVVGQDIATLVTDLSDSNQAGMWRIAVCIKRGREAIPVFISGMKSPADCGHKTREFTAHLSMARYRFTNGRLLKSSVLQGIAVLEGGYGAEERQAFELAGYAVCTLQSLAQTLATLMLTKKSQLVAKSGEKVVQLPSLGLDESLPMAAEDDKPKPLDED